MKKYILLLSFAFITAASFSQTNMYWYNPFGFTPYGMLSGSGTDNELITQDFAGQMWFASNDFSGGGYIHIINQAGTVNDSFPGINNSTSTKWEFYIDRKGIIWIWCDVFLMRDSAHICTSINLPHFWYGHPVGGYETYFGMGITTDSAGNDYFTTSYHVNGTTGLDSIFIIKYDGSTFQTVFTDTISGTYRTVISDGAIYDDSTDALLLNYKARGIRKYHQGQWSTIPLVIDSNATYLLTDKNNNHYFISSRLPNNLYRLHGTSLDTIILPPSAHFGSIWWEYSFTVGPDGNIWLLTGNYGFYDFTTENTWTYIPSPGFSFVYYPAASFNDHILFPSYFDSTGKLWMTGGNDNPPHTIAVYSFTPFNSISGKVFYDSNGNGIADTGELGFTAVNIVQSTNGFYSNTDTVGGYNVIYLDSTIAHVVSASVPQYYHLTTPASDTIRPSDSLCCYNFGVMANGNIQDLSINGASFRTVPGYSSYTWLTYQNTGTIAVSDTITYVFDSALHYQTAYPAPTSVLGHKLSWAYQNLLPFQNNTIAIEFTVDTFATLGDTLHSFANIYPIATDTTPTDNVFVNTQVVSSSFDPNLKSVSPSTWAAPGEELTYTIHFQNTGTSSAINIVVLDTLDKNLDPASFRLLGSSHPVKASLQGPGVLTFTFNNINLPDSSANPMLSTGFVQFAIKIAKPLNHPATSIPNTANILFDFNQAVQTNTATTSYHTNVGIVSVPDNAGLMLDLMPNPATNEVLIKTDETTLKGTLSIYDGLGHLVLSKNIERTSTMLNLQQYSAGIYWVKVLTPDGKTAFAKLIKQ